MTKEEKKEYDRNRRATPEAKAAQKEYYASPFHLRRVCPECGWFHKPFQTDYYVDNAGLEKEICPECGNQDIDTVAGRLIYRHVKRGRWPFSRYETVYPHFEQRDDGGLAR